MKGVELPVNMLIVVVLAVIVFIAAIAFFMGTWGPSTSGVNIEALKNTGCNRLVSSDCGDPSGVILEDIDGDGSADSLFKICRDHYGCNYTQGIPDKYSSFGSQESAEKECCRDRCHC